MTQLDISEITPRLFLGAAPTNLDEHKRELQLREAFELGIGLVVDCRKGTDDSALWQPHGVTYLNLGVEDAGDPLPQWYFSDGIEHIHEHLALHDSNVLVHCEFGAARSPALMLAVLLTDGVPLSEAQNQILTSRDQATSAYFADAAEWYDWYTS